MSSERIDELIALAALGELTPDEERELDEALASDTVLAADADESIATAAALQRLNAEPPPAGLRDSVLGAIAATPQDPVPSSDDASTARFTSGSTTTGKSTLPAPEPPASIDERRRSRRWLPFAAAAAAVVVFAVGSIALFTADDDGGGIGDEIAAVLDAGDAEVRVLEGDLSGSLSVTYSRAENAIVVRGTGLQTLDATRTFELWLVSDADATPAGLFRPDDDGDVEIRFDDIDPTGFVLGVTEEPAGGSATPTLPIIATA